MFSLIFVGLILSVYAVAMLAAVVVAELRAYSSRARCYRRHSLRSLVRGAKRAAIARHYGVRS